jgi:hypothetical protein
LTASQIDNALGDAYAQSQVSTIYNPYSPQQYKVVMEVAPEFWQHPEELNDFYISTAGGAVSGTESTQAVAGTVVLKSTGRRAAPRPRARWPRMPAQCGCQLARDRRSRQQHRLGRQRQPGIGGAAVSLRKGGHQYDAGQRQSHRHIGIDLDCL